MYKMYAVEGGFKFYKNKADRFPFDKMEVGDSFEIALDMRADVRSAAQWYEKKTGKIFRVVTFRDENLARCGRIR